MIMIFLSVECQWDWAQKYCIKLHWFRWIATIVENNNWPIIIMRFGNFKCRGVFCWLHCAPYDISLANDSETQQTSKQKLRPWNKNEREGTNGLRSSTICLDKQRLLCIVCYGWLCVGVRSCNQTCVPVICSIFSCIGYMW